MQSIYTAKGRTIEEQYTDVGRLLSREIKISVAKAKRKRSNLSKIKHKLALRVLNNLKSNKATREFMKILKAWSKGAGITELEAVLLLADNTSGCQTFMAKYASGITLMHTEEDFENIKERMTSPKIIKFKFGRKDKYTIIYNDLLPGAGLYGWEENKIVAVDSLFLTEEGIEKIEKPMLANIVAWMIWRMNPRKASEDRILKLIVKLGLSIDGYAINIVRKVGWKKEAFKLTFTRNEGHVERVGNQLGDYLRQVNVIEPMYHTQDLPIAKWRTAPKNMYKGGWKTFLTRLAVFDKYASKYRKYANYKLRSPKITHQLIHKEIFGKLKHDYINEDLGAVCVGLVDNMGTSVSVGVVEKSKLKKMELFL